MYIELLDEVRHSGWHFDLELDYCGATGEDLEVSLTRCADGSMETGWLRTFHFTSDTSRARRFCKKVARDQDYRDRITRHVCPWQQRDHIFFRSAVWLGKCVDDDTYYRRIKPLYKFIDENLVDIAASVPPDGPSPSLNTVDTLIEPALTALHKAGIETTFSCQGIGGLARLSDFELVLDRYHEPLAYVELCERNDALIDQARQFPNVTVGPYLSWQRPRLSSTHPDHNRAFRDQMVALGAITKGVKS